MLIKRKYSPIGSVLSPCIIFLGVFFYNCENTITDIPIDNNYGVVINEINYRSSDLFNPEDWLELHNPTNETIAMDLWIFKDDNNNVFTIPENTILSAGDFIVLCKDAAAFQTQFPEVTNFIGDFFGLSGGGELLRLFDSNEQLVDKVEYNDIAPWPTEPDGTGPTLELINPSLENDMASNWAASNGNGTPGAINSVYDDE